MAIAIGTLCVALMLVCVVRGQLGARAVIVAGWCFAGAGLAGMLLGIYVLVSGIDTISLPSDAGKKPGL